MWRVSSRYQQRECILECVLVYIYVVLFLMAAIATFAFCDTCSALWSTNTQRCLEVAFQRKASGAPTFLHVHPSPALAADPHPLVPALSHLYSITQNREITQSTYCGNGQCAWEDVSDFFFAFFSAVCFLAEFGPHSPFIKQGNEFETIACFCLQHRPRRELWKNRDARELSFTLAQQLFHRLQNLGKKKCNKATNYLAVSWVNVSSGGLMEWGGPKTGAV